MEWSAVLFYNIEGNIHDPEKLKITVFDLHLMDIGSGAYTEYEFDSSVAKLQTSSERHFNATLGHVHSHNNMGVFFSGTDNSELNDNSEHHKQYLSVIVNNRGDVCARIAYRMSIKKEVTTTYQFTFRNDQGEMVTTTNPPEKSLEEDTFLYIIECDIIKDIPAYQLSQDFLDRAKQVASKRAVPQGGKQGGASTGAGVHPPYQSAAQAGTKSAPTTGAGASAAATNPKVLGSRMEMILNPVNLDSILVKTITGNSDDKRNLEAVLADTFKDGMMIKDSKDVRSLVARFEADFDTHVLQTMGGSMRYQEWPMVYTNCSVRLRTFSARYHFIQPLLDVINKLKLEYDKEREDTEGDVKRRAATSNID